MQLLINKLEETLMVNTARITKRTRAMVMLMLSLLSIRCFLKHLEQSQ